MSVEADRIERLVLAIEARTADILHRSARAIHALFDLEAPPAQRELALSDLHRCAPHWTRLVPEDAALRREIERRLAARHEPVAPDDALLHDLESDLEWVVLPGGETLFSQGDPGDALFVLIRGRLRVTARRSDGAEHVVAEVGPGEAVGEMAVLTGEPRSASVHGIRDSELVRLSRAGFDRLAARHPEVLRRIAKIEVNRLRHMNTGVRPAAPPVAICLVPAGHGTVSPEFAPRLVAALARHGAALHLNRATLDRALGRGTADTAPGDPANDRIVAYLDEQESRFRRIVYEADAAPTPWTDRCLRQGDRVVLVGSADGDPSLNDVERTIFARGLSIVARKDLVLVRTSAETLPSGTAAWLLPRRVEAHYHAGLDSPADFDRLARLLTERAVGVALSGGGARGFAHIGVIRALQEASVPIDVVGGASMGAVIAAQLALGWDVDRMIRSTRAGFVDARPLIDYTLPIVSLLRGRRFERILAAMFGDLQLEDLPLTCFCVSSNLTTGETMVHERGTLRRYVRASTSVPGLLAPVPDQGSLLVDGGLLNNLPADVLLRTCRPENVIAVNVNPRAELGADEEYGESLSAWRLLWRVAAGFGRPSRVPSIHAILERTTMLGSVRQAAEMERGLVGLYLHPPTDDVGLFDVKQIEKIAEVGYRYARERIPAWRNRCAPQSVADDLQT
jgi:predicted acylesterase/phospholipase RssA